MKKHAVMIKKSHSMFMMSNIKVLLLIKKYILFFNDSLTIVFNHFLAQKKPQYKLRF